MNYPHQIRYFCTLNMSRLIARFGLPAVVRHQDVLLRALEKRKAKLKAKQ